MPMANKGSKLKIISGALAAATLLLVGMTSAKAQDSQWKRVCDASTGQEICRIEQEIFVRREKDGQVETLGRLVYAMFVKLPPGTGSPVDYVLDFWLPLGTNLIAGAKMAIDTGPEVEMRFIQCNKNGCLTRHPADQAFIDQLKAGGNLKVGFLPFARQQPIVQDISLIGFTAGINSLN